MDTIFSAAQLSSVFSQSLFQRAVSSCERWETNDIKAIKFPHRYTILPSCLLDVGGVHPGVYKRNLPSSPETKELMLTLRAPLTAS
jgi:hypothetical protein